MTFILKVVALAICPVCKSEVTEINYYGGECEYCYNKFPQKVIFRVDERENQKEVIAVFPDQPGDNNPYRTCGGYVHMGQHTSVSADIMDWTRPAKEDEYKDLKEELESIGYNVRVAHKITRKDFESRKTQCH